MLRPQRSSALAFLFLATSLAPSVAFATSTEPAPTVTESGERGVGVDDADFEELDESIVSDESTEGEQLPFDGVDLSELEAAARAPREDRVTADVEPSMQASGVHDPFPDGIRRTPPRDVWVPGVVGLGLAGSAIVMGRLALLPECGSQDDITSCNGASDGDIGVRGGRVFGAVGFGAGGAVFGAVAGRAFGDWLGQNPRYSLAQKRRIAIGTGTTAVVLGTAGVAVGAGLLGSGAQQAVDIGREFDGDTGALTDAEYAQLNDGLNEVKRARAGFMVLVAAPTILATGISVLVHRPRGAQVSVAPAMSPTYAGMSVRVRF
ncbi:MAG: hypothetical protein ACRBN8_05720 [Nannocystales bacterium]